LLDLVPRVTGSRIVNGPRTRPPRGRLVLCSAARLLVVITVCGCVATPSSTTPAVPLTAPSVTATASGVASPTDSQPPGAILAVNGQGNHAGVLGTYVYRGAGSDAPWLAARALSSIGVPAGGRLVVRLADQRLIGAWSARVAPAGDDQGVMVRGLADQPDENARSAVIELLAPAPGSWVLAVSLDYGDGSGSGSYFWLVEVS
jgi:hypothetical protein